jgi:cytochrome P450
MTTKLDSDFRSYLQDVSDVCSKLLDDIVAGRVDEDDITDEAKEWVVACGSDLLGYVEQARNDVGAAAIDRMELRQMNHREWETAE